MSNRVTHFELPCNDPQKVLDFFHNAYAWVSHGQQRQRGGTKAKHRKADQ